MPGFNNTPPTSEFHRHSSWGRTRGIKNLAGPHGTFLHGGGATLPTAAPSAATDGYSSENQRFLHLLFKNTENDKNHGITVWGYNYAFGVWSELYDTSGNQITIAHVNNQVDEYRIYEISGVDRIYVRSTGNQQFHADDVIAAGLSTF